MKLQTQSPFWNCNCPTGYIHARGESCNGCGASESPNAGTFEIIRAPLSRVLKHLKPVFKFRHKHAEMSRACSFGGTFLPTFKTDQAPDTLPLRDDILAFIGFIALMSILYVSLLIACAANGPIQ